MKTLKFSLAVYVFILASINVAQADYKVTCKSKNYNYKSCPLNDHGYVQLDRNISKTKCKKGRNWDYDRRSIWVDDGCSAVFVVEQRHHTKKHKSEKVAKALLGLALLADASKNKGDHYDRDYHHGGHSSFVPKWMRGKFKGYNPRFRSDITLRIKENGRVVANVNGEKLQGYVNDERLYVGHLAFHVDKARKGIITTQLRDRSNVVHYRRMK